MKTVTMLPPGLGRGLIVGLVSLFFGLTYAFGQSTAAGILVGRVSDDTTKLALAGAQVSVVGTTWLTSTNQQGDYQLSNLPPGAITVEVSFLGYPMQTYQTTIVAGQTVRVDAPLSLGQTIALNAVNVVSDVIGTARAINLERSAAALTNIVAADAIGQLPDKNVAEALERIPGVDLYRDKGEGRFVEVRGLDPVYIGVSFNGIRASSTDKGTREVVLDVISSDMIASLEVSKVSTPDTDADDMGGSVNVVTRSGLDQQGQQAMFSAGTNFSQQEDRHGGYNTSAYWGNNYNNKLGIFVGVVDNYRPFTVYNTETTGFWTPTVSPTDGNTYQMFGTQDFRHYDVQRYRHGIDVSLDYKFNDTSSVFFRYTMSYYTEHDNYWVTEFPFQTYSKLVALSPTSATMVIPAKDILKEVVGVGNSKISTSLVGGYKKKFGSFTDDLTLGYTIGKYTRPTITMAEANTSAMTMSYAFTDPWHDVVTQTAGSNFNDPAQYAFSTKSQFTNTMAGTHEKTAKDDLQKDFEVAGMPAFVKIGAQYRDKDDFQQDSKEGITSLPFSLNSELFPGPDTQYNWGGFEGFRILPQTDQTFYQLQQSIPVTQKPDTGSYMSTEKVAAGYVMGGLTVNKLKILAGIRVEATDFWIQGLQEDLTTLVFSNVYYTHNYANVLPDVILTYAFTPRTIARASWTNSLARPDYAVTIPGRTVDDVNHLVTQGNPEIDALKSMNWDASIEHYYGKVGALSAAVYYKSIENFAYQATSGIDPATGYQINTYFAAPSAWIYGAELAWRQRFDFLPGFLSGLGIAANMTLSNSQVTYPTRPGEKLQFVGLAHEIGNATLTYEKGGLKLHFGVNHHSPRIQVDSALGANSTQDLYEDAFTEYDFGGDYTFHQNWHIYANAANIFSAKLREYYGGTPFKRLSQFENYGPGFEAGMRWTY